MFEIPDVGILTLVKKDVLQLQEDLDEFHISLPVLASSLSVNSPVVLTPSFNRQMVRYLTNSL